VALADAQRQRLVAAGAGLIWCPSSNLHLFGRTADVSSLAVRGHAALGSDSRLSGARDLLEELRIARAASGVDAQSLAAMVGIQAAQLLRLTDRGTLSVGALADLAVLPHSLPLCNATRVDLRMVMVGGIMRYGDRDLGQLLAHSAELAPVRVDSVAKLLDRRLTSFLMRSGLCEPGLEISEKVRRRA
jgi:cytosine/adenosine deaminase-related metal-dependent hydrolase